MPTATGVPDLLLPARDGIAVYLSQPEGQVLARRAASRVPVPGEAWRSAADLEHRYPLPKAETSTATASRISSSAIRCGAGGPSGWRAAPARESS